MKDMLESITTSGTKCPNKYEHGQGTGDYRIVSSAGKIVGFYASENAAVHAYEQYVAKYPDEMDGSSLQVWAKNYRVSGHPYRWTSLM